MGHLPMSKTCFWPVPECPSNRSMLHRVSITEKQGLETLGRIDDLSFQNPEIDPTLARNPPKSPLPSDCATPPTIRQFIPGKSGDAPGRLWRWRRRSSDARDLGLLENLAPQSGSRELFFGWTGYGFRNPCCLSQHGFPEET